MNKQLLDAILDGQLYLVAEYRATYVGRRDFVDQRDGKAKGKVTCRHLIEINSSRGIESVTLFQGIPLTVTDPKDAKLPLLEKGKRYAFPLLSLQKEKGKTSGLLDSEGEVIPVP